jgi:hypothetical protein
VQRLAEVPGLGVDSAQQIIAEVGASAAAFPSAKQLASWMGACPGNEESAGVNYSHRCPNGNRQMRRVLNQAANAAVKAKGTIFALVSFDLEDSAPGHSVRGTRAGRQRRGEEGASAQESPRTARSRLSRRTSPGSIEQPGMIGEIFDPGSSEKLRKPAFFLLIRQGFAIGSPWVSARA